MSLQETIGGFGQLVMSLREGEEKRRFQDMVIKTQTEALGLLEQNANLLIENAELREKLRAKNAESELADKLFHARHALWRKDEIINIAYCPVCWSTRSQLVPLAQDSEDGRCFVCKQNHWRAYDGPRPKDGDPFTVAKPPPIRLPERQKSRREQFREI